MQETSIGAVVGMVADAASGQDCTPSSLFSFVVKLFVTCRLAVDVS